MSPIYEFECKECAYTVEVIQSFDDPPPACPKHQAPMTRVISPTVVVMGGLDGKLRVGEQLKKRNDDYNNSSTGRSEQLNNIKTAHKRVGI